MHLKSVFRLHTMLALLVTLSGCATSMQHASRAGDEGLRSGDVVQMELVDRSDRFPLVPLPGNMLNMAWSPAGARTEQARLAVERLARRLAAAGMVMASSREQAGKLVSLQTESIRRDPLVGWITDGATATVQSAPTRIELCRVSVGGSFITSTLDGVIESLADALLQECRARP